MNFLSIGALNRLSRVYLFRLFGLLRGFSGLRRNRYDTREARSLHLGFKLSERFVRLFLRSLGCHICCLLSSIQSRIQRVFNLSGDAPNLVEHIQQLVAGCSQHLHMRLRLLAPAQKVAEYLLTHLCGFVGDLLGGGTGGVFHLLGFFDSFVKSATGFGAQSVGFQGGCVQTARGSSFGVFQDCCALCGRFGVEGGGCVC